MSRSAAKFGRKMEQAIAALLTQRNVEEAARAVGISTRTLLRWLQAPEFQKAYRDARRAAFSQSIARLQQGATAAATTLLKTMVEPGTSASVRIRAAECVLSHATRAIEIEDIEARVTELERAVEANPSR
jgi:transposase-like protein